MGISFSHTHILYIPLSFHMLTPSYLHVSFWLFLFHLCQNIWQTSNLQKMRYFLKWTLNYPQTLSCPNSSLKIISYFCLRWLRVKLILGATSGRSTHISLLSHQRAWTPLTFQWRLLNLPVQILWFNQISKHLNWTALKLTTVPIHFYLPSKVSFFKSYYHLI